MIVASGILFKHIPFCAVVVPTNTLLATCLKTGSVT